MKSKCAIVTLAIGARYANPWRERCARNWRRYAQRHGYDVICIDHPLDDSERARRRKPAWQKLLIVDQPFAARYERLVWVDADILINPRAPSILEAVPEDRVGAVDEYATPTRELARTALETLYCHWEQTGTAFVRNLTAREFYEAYGLPGRFDEVVQTGVMVLSPRHHRDLLLSVYHRHEDKPAPLDGEMRLLSYELLSAGLLSWLDARFNYTWMRYKALHYPFLLNRPDHPRAADAITAALNDVYFLHFTSNPWEMRLARELRHDKPSSDDFAETRRERKAFGKSLAGWRLATPIVLFIYARPDATRQTLDSIRRVRPKRLLVVADGPPGGASGELRARVADARRLIDEIDWECNVLTEFASGHRGLTSRIVTGLDWAFDSAEEAIVLEDDCVPDPSFFRFCEELLERHREDTRVMGVSGNDFRSDPASRPERYRYSRYPLTWGWATWRRAWRLHDPQMSRWPELRESGWLDRRFHSRHAVAYWMRLFEQTYREHHTWDYAWTLTCWLNNGLFIHPEVNLVTNVGFGGDATHTRDPRSVFANLTTRPAQFPLRHPDQVAVDDEGDRFLEDVMYSGNLVALFRRIRRGRAISQAMHD